jgi:hypothetical protein
MTGAAASLSHTVVRDNERNRTLGDLQGPPLFLDGVRVMCYMVRGPRQEFSERQWLVFRMKAFAATRRNRAAPQRPKSAICA